MLSTQRSSDDRRHRPHRRALARVHGQLPVRAEGRTVTLIVIAAAAAMLLVGLAFAAWDDRRHRRYRDSLESRDWREFNREMRAGRIDRGTETLRGRR